jgi:ubiquinone/menaquinone biosynthesis C-methylase UbiE
LSLYADVLLPRLCHFAMRNRRLLPYRQRVIGAAEGYVLEIGIGSGLNLPLYGAAVREVLALEPAAPLLAMARRVASDPARPVRFIEASAEAIPVDTASVDTVVMTWTLCSIPGAETALREMRRVLRPGGRLLFVEHGRAPDAGVRRWQDRVTPVWRRFSGGCHLNRPIQKLVEDGGFRIDRLRTGYAPGPRLLTFFYEGSARPE